MCFYRNHRIGDFQHNINGHKCTVDNECLIKTLKKENRVKNTHFIPNKIQLNWKQISHFLLKQMDKTPPDDLRLNHTVTRHNHPNHDD